MYLFCVPAAASNLHPPPWATPPPPSPRPTTTASWMNRRPRGIWPVHGFRVSAPFSTSLLLLSCSAAVFFPTTDQTNSLNLPRLPSFPPFPGQFAVSRNSPATDTAAAAAGQSKSDGRPPHCSLSFRPFDSGNGNSGNNVQLLPPLPLS